MDKPTQPWTEFHGALYAATKGPEDYVLWVSYDDGETWREKESGRNEDIPQWVALPEKDK